MSQIQGHSAIGVIQALNGVQGVSVIFDFDVFRIDHNAEEYDNNSVLATQIGVGSVPSLTLRARFAIKTANSNARTEPSAENTMKY